jgi:hypothetical protein
VVETLVMMRVAGKNLLSPPKLTKRPAKKKSRQRVTRKNLASGEEQDDQMSECGDMSALVGVDCTFDSCYNFGTFVELIDALGHLIV